MEETYSRVGLVTALWVAMSVSFYLAPLGVVSAFIICRGLCACTAVFSNRCSSEPLCSAVHHQGLRGR